MSAGPLGAPPAAPFTPAGPLEEPPAESPPGPPLGGTFISAEPPMGPLGEPPMGPVTSERSEVPIGPVTPDPPEESSSGSDTSEPLGSDATTERPPPLP